MGMSNQLQNIKFPGDDQPEQLRPDACRLAYDALFNAAYWLHDNGDPQAAKQARAAIVPVTRWHVSTTSDSVPAKESEALIAALIVAEHAMWNDGENLGHADSKRDELLVSVQRALRATGRRLVERGTNRGWLPMDLWFVAMDETEYWTIQKGHRSSIERIETLYVFDRNKQVHCCEITPSHELIRVETRAIIKSGSPADDDDELREEIYSYVDDGSAHDEDVSYVHVADIEAHLKSNKPGTVYHWGNPGVDLDEKAEEAEEKAKRDIRLTRESTNYKRQEKGEELLAVDAETINRMAAEQFADEANKWEAVEQMIIDEVGQAHRENNVM